MNTRTLRPTLVAALLFLIAGLPLRAEEKPAPKPATARAAKAAPPVNARTKGKLKPVDINHATQNEIGFMLGIPAELAAKIIAGRPYKTKAHLLTRNIVTPEVYEAIKAKVVAGQKPSPAAR